MQDKIKIIDMDFDENSDLTGLHFVSYVENPAIEEHFVKFSNVKMSAVNDERRMVFGPLLIPEQLILRKDDKTGEAFYMRFKAPVIEKAVHTFLKKGFLHNVNLEHKTPMEGVYLCEVWTKWYEDDKSSGMGFDLPIGTAFAGYKVDNDELWAKIKSGEVMGFSIEGLFTAAKETFLKMCSVDKDGIDHEQEFINELENALKLG